MPTASDYQNLITSEHNAQPKFTATVQAGTQAFADLQVTYASIKQAYDFDLATGVNLDAVGLWIGIPRTLKNVLPVKFFGFSDSPTANVARFGEAGLPDIGSRFREETEPSYPNSSLSDTEYKLYLKARIAYNKADGTALSIVNALTFVYSVPVYLIDTGDMAFNIGIAKRLTASEQAISYLYAVIPKPAGVRINQRVYFDPANTFGFAGNSYALPFGEESQWPTTSIPNYLDASWSLDGSRDLSGYRYTRGFGGTLPVIGGIFAEEFNLNIQPY